MIAAFNTHTGNAHDVREGELSEAQIRVQAFFCASVLELPFKPTEQLSLDPSLKVTWRPHAVKALLRIKQRADITSEKGKTWEVLLAGDHSRWEQLIVDSWKAGLDLHVEWDTVQRNVSPQAWHVHCYVSIQPS